MDAARKWLDEGNILNKNERPNPSQLGPSDKLAGLAIKHLSAIQESLPGSLPESIPEGLVSVAVDDMKVLTGLMKLVVVYGIFQNTPDSKLINLSYRLPNWSLPPKQLDSNSLKRLLQLSNDLMNILSKNDDVAKLILISPLMPDILSLNQFFPKNFNLVVSMIPTFNLYKLLIQLRSVQEPSPLVIRTLQHLVLLRKDAVRTMIELIVETKDSDDNGLIDVSHIDKAVVAFASVPPGVPAKTYIESLGSQLYAILSTKSSHASGKIVQATALTVTMLSEAQPKLVGRLRNLIIDPFIHRYQESGDQGSFSNSAGAILNLIEGNSDSSTFSTFIKHIISKVLVSLWLLTCSMGTGDDIDSSIMHLMSLCLEFYPQAAQDLVANLLVQNLPGNLQWSLVSGKEPILVETIGKKQGENESLLKLIDKRTGLFTFVLKQIEDKSATTVLVALMKNYALKDDDAPRFSSPISKLLIAKTIETISQDSEVRQKLFSNSDEIIEFSFSIVAARCVRINNQEKAVPLKNSEPSSLKLEALDIGDSDDEDEEEDGNAAPNTSGGATEENDDDFTELTLSLLGSAFMEALAEKDPESIISEERKKLLELLSTSSTISKSVRAKADFCLELVSGAKLHSKKEVDMSNNDDMLSAAYGALREPLVPSRAYGIHLISKLVERKAIKLETAFEIYGSELGDEDSYVYLNVIKAIEDSTKTHRTEEIIELLLPLIEGTNGEALDRALRARESLIRVLTPGSVHTVSTKLLELLIKDLRASAKDTRDVRFRLSSASMIGIIIAQFPLSVPPYLQTDIADCALGILRHEKEDENTPLRRSAVILCLELVNAVNEDVFTNIPDTTIKSLILEISSLMNETDDDTLKDHCQAVIDSTQLHA